MANMRDSLSYRCLLVLIKGSFLNYDVGIFDKNQKVVFKMAKFNFFYEKVFSRNLLEKIQDVKIQQKETILN